MTKILHNFTKKLNKLDNYFILNEEKDYFIIGTHLTIKEHRTITGNIFQLFSENIDKEFPIFFILAFNDTFSKFKEFRKRSIPILIMPKEFKTSGVALLQEDIDSFIKTKFR